MLWYFLIPFVTTMLGFFLGFKSTGEIDEESGDIMASIPVILGTTLMGCIIGLFALYILIF